MNAVIQNIVSRQSTRDFSAKPVAKADMETLLKAALYAPSGMGRQTWHFTAITNPAIIAELAAAISKVLGRTEYDFYHATALIIPSNARDNKFTTEDNACALQNIFLAANSLGIGSVWINQMSGISDDAEIRPILTRLGIPAEHIVTGIAALGYASFPASGIKEKIGTSSFVE